MEMGLNEAWFLRHAQNSARNHRNSRKNPGSGASRGRSATLAGCARHSPPVSL
jgi:hypothetical protein